MASLKATPMASYRLPHEQKHSSSSKPRPTCLSCNLGAPSDQLEDNPHNQTKRNAMRSQNRASVITLPSTQLTYLSSNGTQLNRPNLNPYTRSQAITNKVPLHDPNNTSRYEHTIGRSSHIGYNKTSSPPPHSEAHHTIRSITLDMLRLRRIYRRTRRKRQHKKNTL